MRFSSHGSVLTNKAMASTDESTFADQSMNVLMGLHLHIFPWKIISSLEQSLALIQTPDGVRIILQTDKI